MSRNRRIVNFAGALVCVGLLAFALYSQFQLGLEPCPLCIFQRVGVAALGVVFLVAAAHHPRAWGRYAYAALIALAALTTAGVAARHLYIQHQPAGSVPACGAPLETMLDMFPLTTVVRKVLTGGGECADINWTFLGLSMPGWVLLFALGLGLLGCIANLRRS